MPELEEGNLWIRDTCPLNTTLARQAAISKEARAIMASYPEVDDVVNQIGRTDDGTDTDGYYNSEFFVPLRPQKDWPAVVEQEGWRRWLYGPKRPRTKEELIAEMDAELERKLPGVDLEFLAEHPRQRDGSALRNQGRQLAEDHRPRLQQAPGPRHAGQEHHANRARASRTWDCSASRGNRTWSFVPTRKSASGGAFRWPT